MENWFVNIVAQQNIIGDGENDPKYLLPKPNSQSDEDIIEGIHREYSEVLELREANIVDDKEVEDMQIQQVYHTMDSDKSVNHNEIRYYSIKTIKVNWLELENSYMHVFIDNTNIKKLEKEKATNKWLHIMFSSISHEFRTPLNAFSNAIEFCKSLEKEQLVNPDNEILRNAYDK